MITKRIEEIDILRGIAALLMVLGHSFISYPTNISTIPWCQAIVHFIYSFHMEMFFVLAGFVYRCTDYSVFIHKKIKRILVPYIFFGIITMFLMAFGGSAVNGTVSLGDGIKKFLLYGGNYWFLYVLFLIFVTYPIIERVFFKWWLEAFLGLALLIIGELEIGKTLSIFTIDSLIRYIPYFITGRIIGVIFCTKKAEKATMITKSMLLCLSLIVYFVFDYLGTKDIIKMGAVNSFIRAIAMCTSLFIIINMILAADKKRNCQSLYDFCSNCGKYSLQFYLFNGFLLTIFRILICNVFHITSPVLIVGGIWIGNVAVTYCACKFIIPHIPIIRDLCGLRI